MVTKRRGLARRRRLVGLSQEALAERLQVDRTTVGRWETGETDPQPWLRPRLAKALSVDLDTIDQLLAEPLTAADDGLQLGDPSQLDVSSIAALRCELLEVQQAYDLAPSTGLLADASQQLGRISYLRANTGSRSLRRELWSLEADAATFMGQLVWDAGQRQDHTAPQRFFGQAVHAARQIKDSSAEAYATLRRSYLALYGQQSAVDGLHFAQEAADIGRPTSPALAGLSHLHVAEAHAMLGERRDCERNLETAEAELARIDDADVASEFLTTTEIDRLAGSCYLALGVAQEAERLLQRAATALQHRQKSRTIVLGNLALAYVHQDEPDAAVAALHQSIDGLEQVRGGGGLNLAFAAGKALAPWRQQPAVQEVSDRLFALMVAGQS